MKSAIPISPTRKLTPADPDWEDWRAQLKHAISTVGELRQWLAVTSEEEEAIERARSRYRWRITPYYASIMDPDDPSCPIRRQAVPHAAELLPSVTADVDPVGDRVYRKTNRVIHKYPNRVAMLLSDSCPVFCRHCTRKFHTTDRSGTYFGDDPDNSIESDLAYIRAHPEICDVLLTGGDPLMLPDRYLSAVLEGLRAIPSVEIIRFGTRFPVLLPQRIDDALCQLLARHEPVFVATHFNHPAEITPASVAACDRLRRHGIPLLNQTVLLKGVNDDPAILATLFRRLVTHGIVPYYLYHCDDVEGVSHFATTIAEGKNIMAGLWGRNTGFAVPRYILTTRLGKIPLWGDQAQAAGDHYILTSYTGETLRVSATGTDLTLKGTPPGDTASLRGGRP